MSRLPDILVMASIPLALAMVLAVVLFSGRMKPASRTRLERAMAVIFYPLVTVFWLWRATEYAGDGDEWRAIAMVVLAVVFGWLGVVAVRAGRLAPAKPADAA